jgi:hypothetical protein
MSLGQAKPEGAALTLPFRFHPHSPTVHFDNAFHQCQPYPIALRPWVKFLKQAKDFLLLLSFDANAIIAYKEVDFV